MNYFSPVFRSSAVTKYAFGCTAMITVTNPAPVDYVQVSRDAHVLVLRQVANRDIVETFTQDRFHELVEAGKVKVDPKRFDTAWQEIRALNPDLEEKGLPKEETSELEFYRRLTVGVERLYREAEMSLSEKSLKAGIAKVYAELVTDITGTPEGEFGAREKVLVPKCPSTGTVRRWRRRLLTLGGNRLALRDRRHATSGRHRTARIEDPLVLSILAEYTRGYLSSNRPTVAHQHRLMKADIAERNKERKAEGLAPLAVPSRSTLERSVRKLDKFEVILAREGEKVAKRAFKVSGRQELATRPGERVAIDNWRSQIALSKLPVWIWDGIPEAKRKKFIKRGRLNFGFAICQATKVVMGVDISANPNAAATLRILQMVCQNKTAIAIAAGCSSTWDHRATPEIIPVDNGSEFVNEVIGNAALELGAEIEFGIAGEPNGRPIVERFLRTLDTGLLPYFTGRTFANIVERGDYNPQEMASVLVDVMSKALVRWIVDVYHNEPHAGLGCETPNDAWERCCEESGAMPAPDADRMRAIFGHVSKRTIGNRGIRQFGLYYKNPATGSLRKAIGQGRVLVKADLQNLGAISMRSREPGSPWITVPCEWDEFEGVSAEQWLGVARDLRHKHANAAKLREETVLAAIRDLDRMGRDAAEAAGIGPVYLTEERLRQAERDLFNGFDTVRTPRKGVAGWAAAGKATDGDGVADEAPVAAADPTEPVSAPEDGRKPIQRRRRGLGPSYLKGE